jgi:peroxiredoxin
MKKLIFYSLMLIYINSFGQLNIGDVAPEFKLKNVDSSYYSLNKNSESKGFIIIFTCNHCPFSQAYEERIIELDKKYKKLGFPVVAINPNDPVKVPEDSFEKMVKQYKEKKFTFPYLHDETQQTAKAYGATRTPHVFILVKEKHL